jgi:hypothetical protein
MTEPTVGLGGGQRGSRASSRARCMGAKRHRSLRTLDRHREAV